MHIGMNEDTKINEYWNDEWGYKDEWTLIR